MFFPTLLQEIMERYVYLLCFIDPIVGAAIFASLTKHMDHNKRMLTAWRACKIAGSISIGTLFIGQKALEILGISETALYLGGGITLLWCGYMLLIESDEDHKSNEDIAIVPLAIPILAGPADIVAHIEIATRAAFLNTLIAALCAQLTVYIAILTVIKCSKILDNSTTKALSTLGGIMTIFIAAEFLSKASCMIGAEVVAGKSPIHQLHQTK